MTHVANIITEANWDTCHDKKCTIMCAPTTPHVIEHAPCQENLWAMNNKIEDYAGPPHIRVAMAMLATA